MAKGEKEEPWITPGMKTQMKGKNKVSILNNMSRAKTFKREKK
jgi:hypothetical protein